ncbi:hypothetical protein BDZ90DRAFT_232673 [Jaminaea rosea]|uniref:GCFC-domain-containing protein n=1 Tax=Jaminaea rosea TaxID=1569628 RepID=A0A316UT85_9BASI|nr:hypothetical protein BDZ90DRAFT_232673 [Jaminaea rosea]PWN27113.1 hypothetical protein BDZ90DRAFT_232673 [Jaminaea rosea]
MSDDEARPAVVTFAKKRRGPKATSSGAVGGSGSAASSKPSSKAHTPAPDDGEEEDDDGGVVVRTAGRRRGGAAIGSSSRIPPSSSSSKRPNARSTISSSALDTDADGDAELDAPIAVKAPRSGLAVPSNLDQASIAPSLLDNDAVASGPSSHYSAQHLADLRQASSRRLETLQQDSASATVELDEHGNPLFSMDHTDSSATPSAYQTLADPTASSGHDSAAFFGAEHLDGASGSMPSQAVIDAAKEQRRRRAAAAAGEGEGGSEDFDSLDQGGSAIEKRSLISRSKGYELDTRSSREDGTVPSLRREEDEEGSGEDEFADFTGAQQRISLDAVKRQKEIERQRREEQARAADSDADMDGSGDDDEDDEFERVQMRRMGAALRQEREARSLDRPRKQHRSAPLPAIAPLPGLGAARSRLEARLTSLQEVQASHEALVERSTHTLSTLNADEEANKGSVVAWGEKEGWARELATFVESLAQLLEERWKGLEEVEVEWDEVLMKRVALVQGVRAREMEDELSLFWGVSGKSLLPARNSAKDKKMGDMEEDDENGAAGTTQKEHAPVNDGDATSPLRAQRRESGPVPANQSAAVLREVVLAPADLAAFTQAQSALHSRLTSLLSSVKAPEFLWPAVTIEGGQPHPSSVHSRFHEWRRRYPQDYAQSWGSLALAGIWEFWARKEVALSDWASLDLEGSECLGAIYQYLEECANAPVEGAGGGEDEEVIGTLVNSAFMSRLVRLASTAYDPWSATQTRQAQRLLVGMADVLPEAGARFQSVVSSLLEAFEEHIGRLDEVLLCSSPALPPPGFHPLSIPARLAFTTRLVGGEGSLLFNLLSLSKLVRSKGGEAQLRVLEALVDRLVSRVAWPLMRECGEAGGQRLAKVVLEILGKSGLSVQADLRARLEGLAA